MMFYKISRLMTNSMSRKKSTCCLTSSCCGCCDHKQQQILFQYQQKIYQDVIEDRDGYTSKRLISRALDNELGGPSIVLKDGFTGVGVDIRVNNSVCFGLAASVEDLVQEGGRAMRGSSEETEGRQGYSFFLHKGALGEFLK